MFHVRSVGVNPAYLQGNGSRVDPCTNDDSNTALSENADTADLLYATIDKFLDSKPSEFMQSSFDFLFLNSRIAQDLCILLFKRIF